MSVVTKEDAIKFVPIAAKLAGEPYLMEVAEATVKMLEDQPDVVRCRDCVMAERWNSVLLCRNEIIKTAYVPDNWYCGDGRKKDGQ